MNRILFCITMVLLLAGLSFAGQRYTHDTLLVLKDAYAVNATAVAKVDGSDKTLHVGTGLIRADLVIDVSAIEIDSDNELYVVSIQGGDAADFSGDHVCLARLELGAASVLDGNVNSTVGRYVLPFVNEGQDVVYPYLRVRTEVSGTAATGINYTAFIGAN